MTERVLHFEHAILRTEGVSEGVDPLTKEAVIRIPADVTMEGVMNGAYKPASEVENPMFWRFFEGLPYVADHPAGEQVVITAASQVAGYSDKPRLRHKGKRPFISTRLNIYKDRDQGKLALHRIFDLGMDEVSIGFWTNPQRMEGDYFDPALDEDVHYVEVETDMKPDHVATVDRGACSGEMGCGLKREAKLNDPVRVTDFPMGEDGQPLGDLKGPAAAAFRTAGPGAASGIWEHGSDSTLTSPPFLETEGAIAPHGGTKAPENTRWSFTGADGNAIIERGGFAAYKQAHAWVEGTGTPEEKNKYKLPHHKVVGNAVMVVFRGLAAAAVVIGGGRAPLKVPPGDVAGIKRHIAAHYKQFDREPPFDAQGEAARDWLYQEELDALMEEWKADTKGLQDHPWFDLPVREEAGKSGFWNRVRQMLHIHDSGGGDPAKPQGDASMCGKCETLEQERDVVAAKLATMKTELETLTTEREDQEREDLLTRLGAATGLKDDALTKTLQETGILPDEEDAVADLEALRTATRSVELMNPRANTKAVGSVGDVAPVAQVSGFTVGRRGVDYDIDKHGNVVDLTEAAEDKDDVLVKIRDMVAKEVA